MANFISLEKEQDKQLKEFSLSLTAFEGRHKTIEITLAELTNSKSDPHLHNESETDFNSLQSRLETLEVLVSQNPAHGIFAYIGSEDHKTLFTRKVREAIDQELTYSQIDEFLSQALPSDLDEIIKAHPTLAKNFIRNLRK